MTQEGMHKLRLNFPAGTKESDLLGRVMGHDMYGAFYYVQAVFELPERTECNLMPLGPELFRHTYEDDFGQVWVNF